MKIKTIETAEALARVVSAEPDRRAAEYLITKVLDSAINAERERCARIAVSWARI